ncbi:MAG: hypothetical protein IJP67_04375 [Oscillospiraceae bacterium]|nr:hypothetical protein [Oscillospiraceae bacterium]
MLFNKKIEPSCSYCAHSTQINDTEAACIKNGVVSLAGQCRHFKYDPLRREPPHPATIDKSRYSEEDFKL